jgi:hypothetical protein
MEILKIVTHDQKTFLCHTREELERFLSNYRTDEEPRLKREFPNNQFLVDHIEVTEMTEEDTEDIRQLQNRSIISGKGEVMIMIPKEKAEVKLNCIYAAVNVLGMNNSSSYSARTRKPRPNMEEVLVEAEKIWKWVSGKEKLERRITKGENY